MSKNIKIHGTYASNEAVERAKLAAKYMQIGGPNDSLDARRKPTIEELERILSQDKKPLIEIKPDGSLKTTSVPMDFQKELVALINRNSVENGSDTPDFILGEYLVSCLEAFNEATMRRQHFYRKSDPEPVSPPNENL